MADVLTVSAADVPIVHPFDILLQIDERVRSRAPVTGSSAQLSEIRGRLAIRLDARNLLFSMDDIAEIIPVPRITKVPGVKNWLLGIANLRGKVISVSDLRCFLTGRSSTVQLQNSQLVVVRGGEWDYGLLVDEVIGMRHFGTQNRVSELDTVDVNIRPYVDNAFLHENQHWLLFNTSLLLKDPRFTNAAAL